MSNGASLRGGEWGGGVGAPTRLDAPPVSHRQIIRWPDCPTHVSVAAVTTNLPGGKIPVLPQTKTKSSYITGRKCCLKEEFPPGRRNGHLLQEKKLELLLVARLWVW